MLITGYAKDYYYDSSSCMYIRVRIPNIHGAYKQQEYEGQQIKNYTLDENLPYYRSIELPRAPREGDIVLLASTSDGNGSERVVIGLMGSSYNDGKTIIDAAGSAIASVARAPFDAIDSMSKMVASAMENPFDWRSDKVKK